MRLSLLVLWFSWFVVGPASADRWDSKGWVKLGERTVSGRVDRDTITVGAYKGRFTKLTLVVEKSDLELMDFQITFANNETFNPRVQHFFRENSRTRVIDLPGDERVIKKIDLKYRNLAGGGAASVEVWGWSSDSAPMPGNPGPRPAWDPKGWDKLGERTVSGRVDRDTITVGAYKGRYSKLTLVVEKSDLELLDFEITFGNNETFNPRVQHFFRENSRTRVIDLPGDERVIKKIDLKYRNLAGGGAASVAVWGWTPDERPGGPRPIAQPWAPTGWQMLGERTVTGRVDRDRITVGRYRGKFEKLTIVVLDSDLELLDFDVKFARGPAWNPSLKHTFREGQRTHAIDFPGDERTIRYIDMKYANLPGGGRARVQVWGK